MDHHMRTIMLALLLSMFVAFPAMALDEPEVSLLEARRNAAMSIIEHVGFEAPFVEEWRDATLGEADLIYDANGEALLYRFAVERWGEVIGSVDAAATPYWGVTVVALTFGDQVFELAAAVDEAVAVVERAYPGAEVIGVAQAMYQYPRIGILVEYLDLEGIVQSVILDLETFEPLAERGEGEPGSIRVVALAEHLRRDELAEAKAGQFHDELVANLEMGGVLRSELALDPELLEPVQPDQWSNVGVTLANLGWNQAQVRVVDVSRLKLIKQEEWDWCARAVAQMIEYYHTQKVTLTQKQIDTILDNDGWWTDWTTALVNFYQQRQNMTHSWVDSNMTQYTTSDATKQQNGFQEYQQQINDGFPISDNILGHSRMGVGYRVTNKHTGVDYFEVGIYDPLGSSNVRWELGWTDSMLGFRAIGTREYPVYVRNTP
jgi:hypothetical protein